MVNSFSMPIGMACALMSGLLLIQVPSSNTTTQPAPEPYSVVTVDNDTGVITGKYVRATAPALAVTDARARAAGAVWPYTRDLQDEPGAQKGIAYIAEMLTASGAVAPASREQIAAALAFFRSCPEFDGWEFDSQAAITCVNEFAKLGGPGACAVLEYLLTEAPGLFYAAGSSDRFGAWMDVEWRAHALLQLLFEFAPADCSARLGSADVRTAVMRQWPRFPFAIEGGVPFLLIPGFSLEGHHFHATSVIRCLRYNRVEPVPLVPEQSVSVAAEQLIASGRLKGLGSDVSKMIRMQANPHLNPCDE